MRRKSARNAQKATPEKATKEVETPPKTRRSRRRKRSPSKSSESEDEVLPQPPPPKQPEIEETPDTTTKSHTPSDEESEEPVWKVTSTEDASKGEIQKLKICLTRPLAPDSPDKNRSRRSKSNSHTEDDATSSEDKSQSSMRRTRSRGSFANNDGVASQDEDGDEKKGKGKSKGKHKSKIEKSPQLTETDIQSNNEISENVQVTPQSPSIDNPVDNENQCKVGVDDLQNDESRGDFVQENASNSDTLNSKSVNVRDSRKQSDSDEDEPLIVLKQTAEDADQLARAKTPQKVPEIETETPELENQTVQSPELDNQTVQKPESDSKQEQPLEIQQSLVEEAQIEIEQKPVGDLQVKEKSAEPEAPNQAENASEHNEGEDSKDIAVTTTHHATEENGTVIEETPQLAVEKEPSSVDVAVVKSVRRKLIRNNELPKTESTEEKDEAESPPQIPPIKPLKTKRTWSSSGTSELVKINLAVIQTVCPTIEFPEEPDLKVEFPKERRTSESSIKKLQRKVSIEYKSDNEKPSYEKQISSGSQDNDENIIAFNRKISIVDDTASKLRPPPSPAKNPLSDILHITNLVRPFTLKQLKELLERTGKIKEEGFWTDRIKSKCYVQYETQEEAEATRNALHGVQWPIGNGKNLIIDYSSVEEMQTAKNPPAPPPPPSIPEPNIPPKENLEPIDKRKKIEEKPSKDMEKKRSDGPVREWDIGKREFQRERSRSRERIRKHRRSRSPEADFMSRKQRKLEENIPQKMMDDLFLKTKSTPSIYWQPLSPEEISMKEQQRLIRMEEHKRRMEETSRMRPRDVGRGAYRRRYD